MARRAAGQLTVVDISDGIDPIVAFTTNENHTFAADENGTVASATRAGFSSDVRVFVGQSSAVFTTDSTLSSGVENTPQYRISSIDYVNGVGTCLLYTSPSPRDS